MLDNYKIDSLEKALLYIVTIFVIGILIFTKKKNLKFSFRVLIGMVLGLIVGLTLGQTKTTVSGQEVTITRTILPIGQLYIRLIQMVIMPLVVTAIIKSFTSLESTDKLKRIGLKTLFWLLFTTLIATAIGFVFASLAKLGQGYELIDRTPNAIKPIETVILEFFPNNIVAALGGSVVIPAVVFAIFVAIAIMVESKRHPERVKPFLDFNNSLNTIMTRITKFVMRLTPYAVYAFMAYAVGRNNYETLRQLGSYILVIFAAMLVHFILIQMGLLKVNGIAPIRFTKKFSPALMVAFTTQSSYGTLPVTIKSLTERVGVSEKIANFVGPIGANVGLNACGGIFPAMVAVITANATGRTFGVVEIVLLLIITTISSIGIAGVPGIATIAATVTLAALNLPLEGIALVAAVDPLVDMLRTMVNVNGAGVTAALVAKSEKEFDFEIFNNKKEISLAE